MTAAPDLIQGSMPPFIQPTAFFSPLSRSCLLLLPSLSSTCAASTFLPEPFSSLLPPATFPNLLHHSFALAVLNTHSCLFFAQHPRHKYAFPVHSSPVNQYLPNSPDHHLLLKCPGSHCQKETRKARGYHGTCRASKKSASE